METSTAYHVPRTSLEADQFVNEFIDFCSRYSHELLPSFKYFIGNLFFVYSFCIKMELSGPHEEEKIHQYTVNLAKWSGCIRVCLLYTSDAADEEDSVDLGGR